jgi:uncharacterized protein (DUF111 family)
VDRRKLPRTHKEINTSLGNVKVKAVDTDGVERLVPEFEECKRIAAEKKLSLLEVYRILESEMRR